MNKDKKLYFYVLTNPDVVSKCKIGITTNPESRLRSYRTANPQCSYELLTEIENRKFEKDFLFNIKAQFRVDREYVWCSPKVISSIASSMLNDY